MTKRSLYTREEVLHGSSDLDSDLSDTEDCDCPIADGSDDEFMDLHEEEEYSIQHRHTPRQPLSPPDPPLSPPDPPLSPPNPPLSPPDPPLTPPDLEPPVPPHATTSR